MVLAGVVLLPEFQPFLWKRALKNVWGKCGSVIGDNSRVERVNERVHSLEDVGAAKK